MTLSKRYCALGVIALLVLQVLWHAILLPANPESRWLLTALYTLPLLPAFILLLARRPSAHFWAGVAALFYFCHGVAEAWTTPGARPLALFETALAVWTIVSGSWAGVASRFSRTSRDKGNV